MLNKTLLIELATEELPYKNLKNIAQSFYHRIIEELNHFKLSYKSIEWFATPRRLAIKVNSLNTIRIIPKTKKIGPLLSDAFDNNGNITKPTNAWLKRLAINIEQTKRLKNPSGEWLVYITESKSENIETLLPEIISFAIKKISIPKSMKWDETNIKFSRPIRNIFILLDDKVLTGNILNLPTSTSIQGHFFMKNYRININHAKEYPLILLKEGNVICDYSYRQNKIKKKIHLNALDLGGIIINNEILLQEVTALVEWPTVLIGKFKKKFLSLPQSSIIYILENIQKCFPVYSQAGTLMPFFIFVSNINPKNLTNIIHGNEQVVNSRLSDAQFFYNMDRKQPLEQYLIHLKKIVFYNKLGSMYEKTLRLKLLMKWFSKLLNIDITKSIRAALLSKCDLITNMVSEFPNIQGSIGMEYALSDGEDKDVAKAIKEHYYPAFSEDKLPSNPIASTLAIVDKIDTIVGMFITFNQPKKNKDPFALRRLALSVLKILISKKIEIDLLMLIKKSILLYQNTVPSDTLINNINIFFVNRLIAFYKKQGFNTNIIKSVITLKLTHPTDIHNRITILSNLKNLDNLNLLISTYKRITNILETSKDFKHTTIKKTLMLSIIEKKLYSETNKFNLLIQSDIYLKNYENIFNKAIKLCNSINCFFNTVVIKDKHHDIHFNRLSLINYIKELFIKVANFSYLNTFKIK